MVGVTVGSNEVGVTSNSPLAPSVAEGDAAASAVVGVTVGSTAVSVTAAVSVTTVAVVASEVGPTSTVPLLDSPVATVIGTSLGVGDASSTMATPFVA
jgi:hypothetical protein